VNLRLGTLLAALLGVAPLFAAPSARPVQDAAVTSPSRPLLDLEHLHIERRAPAKVSGESVNLTLDWELQNLANDLMAKARPVWGGAVMTDIQTGKVLVWGQFTRHGRSHYEELSTRAAPSASLFKLVTTAALLEHTPVTIRTRVCVAGGDHAIFRRHLQVPAAGTPDTHCLPFFQALGFSVNAAYAQLVTEYLSRDQLLETINRLGFNRPLPFDALARFGSAAVPFSDLDFARTATGFEGTTLTVLGAAQLAHTIALEGRAPRLYLVQGGDDRKPRTVATQRALRATTARRLARMMEVTVHSGTALEAFTDPATGISYLDDLRVAGKTGTLKRDNATTISWFTGFAPARAPRVAVTVMLENDSTWRHKAADLARDLLRGRFKGHAGIAYPIVAARNDAAD